MLSVAVTVGAVFLYMVVTRHAVALALVRNLW